MIEPPAIMNRALPKNGNGQRFLKCFLKKALHLPGVRQDPGAAAVVANHGRSTYKCHLSELACSFESSLRPPLQAEYRQSDGPRRQLFRSTSATLSFATVTARSLVSSSFLEINPAAKSSFD